MRGQGWTKAIEALPKVGNVLHHGVYVGVSRVMTRQMPEGGTELLTGLRFVLPLTDRSVDAS